MWENKDKGFHGGVWPELSPTPYSMPDAVALEEIKKVVQENGGWWVDKLLKIEDILIACGVVGERGKDADRDVYDY